MISLTFRLHALGKSSSMIAFGFLLFLDFGLIIPFCLVSDAFKKVLFVFFLI